MKRINFVAGRKILPAKPPGNCLGKKRGRELALGGFNCDEPFSIHQIHYSNMKSLYKTAVTLLILLLFAGTLGFTGEIDTAGRKRNFTILSYNVRNCRGMDDSTDYQRVAAIIKRNKPDVVALQELDSATRRSDGVVVLE